MAITNKSIRLALIGALFCLVGTPAMLQASEFDQQVTEALEQARAALVSAKAAIDSVDIYRRPHVPEGLRKDRALTCRQLEQEMVSHTPLTYRYKPGYFEDPIQGAALWVGPVYEEAYLIFWYGLYYDYQESRRIISAEDRIETLRRLKAEKRCFED